MVCGMVCGRINRETSPINIAEGYKLIYIALYAERLARTGVVIILRNNIGKIKKISERS